MKVLHFINNLSAGGAELHLLTLCRYLKRRGVKLVVACLREQTIGGSRSLAPDFEKEAIRVLNLQADSRYDWRFFRRFARVLKEEQPDILHTHLPRADLAGVFGRFLCPNVRWVCSVHAFYNESWSGRWMLPIFNSVWRRADAVVAISQAVKHWLVNERHLPANTVSVIHYGIEHERFVRPSVDIRRKWELDGRAVVGSVGRLEPGKGYDVLIKAMATVCKRVPHVLLLIAGHDPWSYRRTLEALVDRLGLRDHVQFVGFQKDVASFIHSLDVFTFASRSEGFGQVVVEAMAAGKAVVASKIPPLAEIVLDDETGLLTEANKPEAFARAICQLLEKPDLASQMGKIGQERILRLFSADRMVNETTLLYENLLTTPRVISEACVRTPVDK